MAEKKGGSRRGFAAMDAEKQRAIASKGGKAAHQKGTAHQFTSEEAREAGRKGGQAQARKSQQAMANRQATTGRAPREEFQPEETREERAVTPNKGFPKNESVESIPKEDEEYSSTTDWREVEEPMRRLG
jgi:uncharacterized protein